MSKTKKSLAKRGSKTAFQVKPVRPGLIASIVLEELSRNYGDVCNYFEASVLARRGEYYLALLSVEQQNQRILGHVVCTPRVVWVTEQARAVLKKLVDPAVDRWEAARKQWFSTEHHCKRVNQRLAALEKRHAEGIKPIPFAHEHVKFYQAVRFVLGPVPPLDEIYESAYYGPGSTVDVRGREVHFVRKSESYECTARAQKHAAEALAHDKVAWAHAGMDPIFAHNESAKAGFIRVIRELLQGHVSDQDRLMFVHKNMEALRSIGAQPTVSGMLQLGTHVYLARVLGHVGIDLADQGKNQKLAYLGSKYWEECDPFVTLDKTNASNHTARNLPRLRFPAPWARFLEDIRSPGYLAPPELGGGEHIYEMYAGMGNGTTFGVETLIFFAAAYATSEEDSVEEFVRKAEYAIYGDDVVLRKRHALRYMRFVTHLGYKVNEKKTHLEGPFRESCGADYYGGVLVRPATLNVEEYVQPLDIIGFHNTLADQPNFPLKTALERIRGVWESAYYPKVPTDPQGNLGFRPSDENGYYSIVRDSEGRPKKSEAWQRPRCYVLDVKTVYGTLGNLDPWTQLAVSLLRGRQDGFNGSKWSLPLRDATTIKVVPEQDLRKKDLQTMLLNQLRRLAHRREQPWWDAHHGK